MIEAKQEYRSGSGASDMNSGYIIKAVNSKGDTYFIYNRSFNYTRIPVWMGDEKYYFATKEHASKVCLDMYASLTVIEAAELRTYTPYYVEFDVLRRFCT